MTAFLRDLFARPGSPRTVIIMEPDAMSTPRQYEVRPGMLIYVGLAAALVLAALLIALVVVLPLGSRLGGASAAELRRLAEASASRADALSDSLDAQTEQLDLLRAFLVGDTLLAPPEPASVPEDAPEPRPAPSPTASAPPTPAPLEAPTLGPGTRTVADAYLGRLRLPVRAPLDGVVSRGFRPADGHFGLDLAAPEDTPVHTFAEGTIAFADWTHAGGYVVAVQHPGGYLSVYKHNRRLLRRVGERVQARDEIARSGNTGATTSGPHLHVEVWHDGLPLDPATVFSRR